MLKIDEMSKAMTIRDFLELCSANEEVYLYNLFDDSEITASVDDMDDIIEDVLDSEIESWDYHMERDNKGWEKVGARLCLNYSLED